MNWPPSIAWTSNHFRKGYRHFVALNYGGEGPSSWVLLVSVLDSKALFKVSRDELSDHSQWTIGWLSLSRAESICSNSFTEEDSPPDYSIESYCLHPSGDSGLTAPLCKDVIRDWFE